MTIDYCEHAQVDYHDYGDHHACSPPPLFLLLLLLINIKIVMFILIMVETVKW